jgi:predicted transcriptional regulator
MGKRAAGKAYVGAYVEAALIRRLDRLARARKVNRSRIVEQLLNDGVERDELMVKMTTDPVLSRAMMQAVSRSEVMTQLLRSMREEMTDDQLQLFEDRLAAALGQEQEPTSRKAKK